MQILSLVDVTIPHDINNFNEIYLVSPLVETDLRQVIKSGYWIACHNLWFHLFLLGSSCPINTYGTLFSSCCVEFIICTRRMLFTVTWYSFSWMYTQFSDRFRNLVTFWWVQTVLLKYVTWEWHVSFPRGQRLIRLEVCPILTEVSSPWLHMWRLDGMANAWLTITF